MTPARLRVYLAGPYSKGDVEQNVRTAIEVWHELHDAGFSPFCPHLTHYLDCVKKLHYEQYMTFDFEWLAQCEALLRIPGESLGADREVAEANRLGIQTFFSIDDLIEWFREPGC